ncbi:MAG: HEAT repeat domain-containing protein [Armatimonadetes bacterium]|nr:HEAT repeat domain-containing protein [Armatimonadota bacterium]
MNRKYLNYAIFIAIVAVVIGLAVRHSRHMAFLVDSMAGSDSAARISGAKELVKGEQFMDSITGETVPRRVAIVQAVEDWGDKDATRQAVAFLKDPDRPVRDRLLVGVLRLAGKSDENLQEVANGIKDGDGNVRALCVTALQVLGDSDRAAARTRLSRALPDAKDALLDEVLDGRKPQGAGKIIPMVVALMKADPNARGTGGDVLAVYDAEAEECVKAVSPMVDDKDDGIASGAITTLGKIGSATPIPRLKSKLASCSPQVRRVVIGAIALIADVSGQDVLIAALNTPSEDNEARAQAAVGLGRIATGPALEALDTALSDADLKVQLAAVSALARGGKKSLPVLLAALKHTDPVVRGRAARALAGISAPEANPALIAALGDSSETVASEAALAMGFEGNSGAVSALVSRLGAADSTRAIGAADALSAIGAAAQPALAAALGKGGQVSYYASRSLTKQGQAAVPAIVKAASAGPVAARWAATALGAIGGPEARQGLESISKSGDAEAQQIASNALTRMNMN